MLHKKSPVEAQGEESSRWEEEPQSEVWGLELPLASCVTSDMLRNL